MSSTAFSEDFTNLASWPTSSGMAVSGGELKASVDNSTVGKISRNFESVVGGSNVRLAFDFVVDTSMTAGTQIAVSLLDPTSAQGNGVYLKQGVGIVSALYLTTPGFTQTTTMLAWASLVNGGRYHVEITNNPGSFYGFYSLYDPSGNLVTRTTCNAVSVDWFNVSKLLIESNATKSSVSRLSIDPSLVGSTTTAKYFTNTAKFTFFQALDNTPVDLYIPGGGNINELAVYFHGSGQTPNFVEITTIATGGTLLQAFLKLGVMVVVPQIPATAGGGDSWGNDYGAASVLSAVTVARGILGNPNAKQHYVAYSMGGLTAGRLIGNDGATYVKSWYILRDVLDVARAEQNTFQTGIDTAWAVSAQPSYAAALVTFARGNPLGLLNSNPARYAGVTMFIDYSTGDGTVPQVDHCVAFAALLTVKGIPFKSSVKAFANHTENSTIGDATTFLAQTLSSSAGRGRVTSMALGL